MWTNTCQGGRYPEHYVSADPDAPDNLCAACRMTMLEAEKTAPTSWQLFALEREGKFDHFYPSTIQVRMCSTEHPIALVQLTLDDDGPYYGWQYSFHPANGTSKGQVGMVYFNEMAVRVCFAYGPEVEEKRGRGRIVRLKVEKIRVAVHPEGLK